jgi:hypothetical protein
MDYSRHHGITVTLTEFPHEFGQRHRNSVVP